LINPLFVVSFIPQRFLYPRHCDGPLCSLQKQAECVRGISCFCVLLLSSRCFELIAYALYRNSFNLVYAFSLGSNLSLNHPSCSLLLSTGRSMRLKRRWTVGYRSDFFFSLMLFLLFLCTMRGV